MAVVKGVAIAPGVSRNGRLYTKEILAKAYHRLSERISEGLNPVIMRTHHDAKDDSLRIAARVRKVGLTDDGAITYEAVTTKTSAGKEIAALAEGQDRALAHVSIYGAWVGGSRRAVVDGRTVETGDDLEIDKIDFTATPGVLSATAQVEAFDPSDDPNVLCESMRPVALFVDENDTEPDDDAMEAAKKSKAPYGDVEYADPGYQADKKKRYPIDTKAHVRAAWSYINKSVDAGQYTAQQLASIKARIKAAAKKFGIDIKESMTDDQISEAMGASSCMNLSACVGGFDISVCAYNVDAADLDAYTDVAQEAIQAALGILSTGPHDTDSKGETTTPTSQAGETMEGADMTDNTEQVEQATQVAASPIDYDRLAETIVSAIRAGMDNAPAAQETATVETTAEETTKTEPPTAEQVKESVIAQLLADGVIQPARKGRGLTETTTAEQSRDAWEHRGEDFARAFLGGE